MKDRESAVNREKLNDGNKVPAIIFVLYPQVDKHMQVQFQSTEDAQRNEVFSEVRNNEGQCCKCLQQALEYESSFDLVNQNVFEVLS